MIGMPADREGQDDDPRREVADVARHDAPRLVGVEQAGVGQAGIPSFGHAKDGGGALGLLGAQGGTAAGAALAGGEVEDAGAMTLVDRRAAGCRRR